MTRSPRTRQQLLIGGKWVDAGDGTYDIINPATEQVVGQAPNASVDDAEPPRPRPRPRPFPAWAATPAEERLALLKQAARGHPGQGRRAGAPGHRRDRRHRLGRARACRCRSARPVRALLPGHPPRPGVDAAARRHRGHAAGPRRTDQRPGLPPAGRRGGRHRQLQLPADQHGRQGGPGPGHGQHRGHEAGPPGSAGRRRAGPGPRRGRASLPAWSTWSTRRGPSRPRP